MKSDTQTARKDFRIPAGIFVSAAVLLAAIGCVGWHAADFPVPDFWDDNIKEKEGMWKEGGALQKLETLRVSLWKQKWIASTKKLQLAGTVWRTRETAGNFYEFGEDGIFRVRPVKLTRARAIYEVSGSRFEFAPSKGYYAVSGRTTQFTPNLFFYDGEKQIGIGSIGYNGTNLWFAARKPNHGWDSKMTRVPSNAELPPAVDSAMVNP